MAFDTLAERHAMVGLDYQPDGTGFDDAGSMLMATGWGEDIDSDGGGGEEPPPPPGTSDLLPEVLIGKFRYARAHPRRRR